MNDSPMLIGQSAVANFLDISRAKFYRLKPELIQYRVIFKHRKGRRIYWCSFPHLLEIYIILKSSKGEIL